jgi:hypothetical protein
VPPPPRPRSQSVGNLPPGYVPQNGRAAPPVPSAAPIGQPVMPLGGPIGVPMASPTAPTVQPMQGMQAVRPQMLGDPMQGMQPLPGVMPTTIPGQGPPVPPSQPQVPAFSYPNVGDIRPQLGQLQILPNGTPRDATSTALVQPTPYGMPPGMTPATYGLAQPQPQLFTKKVKLLIGGALLMVLAAIATIAIIKGSSGDKKKTSESSVAPAESKKDQPKVAVTEIPKDDKKLDLQKKLDEQASLEKAEAQKKLDEQKKAEDQKKLDDQKKAEDQKKLDEQKRVAEEQKKAAEEQKRADDQKRLEAKRADDQRKAEEAQRRAEERKAEQARKADEARERKLEAQRKADEAKKKKLEKKETSVAANTSSSTTKRSADTSEIKSKADTLYRARKFKDAGQVLRSAASSLGEADARELKSTAAAYEQVGAAYNVGMGQGTSPVDAYTNLTKALNLDRPFGVFTDEIKAKLGQVAPKAATKYMADKSYEQAFTAVRVAEGNGGSNSTTLAIRGALVDRANELYQEAMSLKDSDKDAARQKLQRIRGMVDGKTPVLVKAEKALRELPR